MKILITGCAGFIGYHLAKKLLKVGFKVTGVDNFSDYYETELKKTRLNEIKHKNFIFFERDINFLNLKDTSFDCCINLAAQPGVRIPKQYEKEYLTTNISGFKSVIDFCLKNNINKIIYASSSSVYSDNCKIPFSESSLELCPQSFYGATKLFNEHYASIAHNKYGLSCIGLRFFTVYGTFGRPDMAYFSFARNIKKNKTITLFNKGDLARDMTHVSDIVEGILSALNYIGNEKLINEKFNLGNNSPIATKRLVSILEENLNKKAVIKNIKVKNELAATHADLFKSSKILDFAPKTNINDGLKEFTKWLKEYEG